MKRSIRIIAIGFLLALSSGLATAQAIDPAPDPALPYRLLELPEDEVILGISPDSRTILTGATYPDCLRFYRTEDLSLCAETTLPDNVALPKEKKAVWSRDGKYVALRSCQKSPWELKAFKSFCVFAVEAATGTFIQLCDDRFMEKFSLQKPNIYFDPGFGPGKGKALYHKWTDKGTQVVSVDLKDKQESVLYLDPSRKETLYSYPLFESFVLLNVSPYDLTIPDRILTLDSRDGSVRVALSGDHEGCKSLFEVVDVAADGKTALVSYVAMKRYPGGAIDSLHLLTFDEDGSSSDQRVDNPEGYQILTARLSPNARTLALVVRETDSAEGAEPAASVLTIDLKEERIETLMSDSDPIMIPGILPVRPGFGTPQGLFLSNSSLILSCSDGFRLYALE
jgi:hypothetical protein